MRIEGFYLYCYVILNLLITIYYYNQIIRTGTKELLYDRANRNRIYKT